MLPLHRANEGRDSEPIDSTSTGTRSPTPNPQPPVPTLHSAVVMIQQATQTVTSRGIVSADETDNSRITASPRRRARTNVRVIGCQKERPTPPRAISSRQPTSQSRTDQTAKREDHAVGQRQRAKRLADVVEQGRAEKVRICMSITFQPATEIQTVALVGDTHQ